MSCTYWLVGRLYATYPESFKQGQGVQILILQVVTFSRICLNHVLSQCFSCLSTFDMLVLAPCMVPTLHECQASAPSRSPQRRNSKSQEVEEDAGVFCSWTAVSYMHTSQNTAASSVCCSVVLPKCDMRKVNWMESTTKSCCHSYIRHPAPCLTRTKRPRWHASNFNVRSTYTQPGTGCARMQDFSKLPVTFFITAMFADIWRAVKPTKLQKRRLIWRRMDL